MNKQFRCDRIDLFRNQYIYIYLRIYATDDELRLLFITFVSYAIRKQFNMKKVETKKKEYLLGPPMRQPIKNVCDARNCVSIECQSCKFQCLSCPISYFSSFYFSFTHNRMMINTLCHSCSWCHDHEISFTHWENGCFPNPTIILLCFDGD